MRGARATGSFSPSLSRVSAAMSNWPPDWLHNYPAGVQETLDAALSGSLEAPIVLTRLFLLLGNAGEISSLLSRAESERQAAGDEEGSERLRAVRDRAAADPAAFDKMRDVLAILHGDGSFDLVLAVDSFPYIVAARPDLAGVHIRESARVLAPGGSLAIFNFAYTEDFGTSRERLRRAGDEAGVKLMAAEPNPLRSW